MEVDRRSLLLGSACALLAPSLSFAMAANYPRAIANVLVHEGGYSNHPSDPGGVTLEGVIQVRYNQYRRARGLPLKALTRSMQRDPSWIRERNEIYRIYYADPVSFDALPFGLDYTIFDYAVNSGIGRAPKVLQRILGVEVDGKIGPQTLAAVARSNTKTLIRAVNDERMRFLRALRTFPVFGPGWTRRVQSVNTISLLMSDGRRADNYGFRPMYGPGKAFDPEEVIP